MDDNSELPQRPVPNQVIHPGEKPAQPPKDITVQVPHDAQQPSAGKPEQADDTSQLSHVLIEQMEADQAQSEPEQPEAGQAATVPTGQSPEPQESGQTGVQAPVESEAVGQAPEAATPLAQPQQAVPLPHLQGVGRPMRMGVRRHKGGKGAYAFIIIFFLLAGAGAGYYVYQTYNKQASQLDKENAQLTSQLSDLDKQTKQQEDANKGVAAASKTNDSNPGKISLADGKVTLDMPKDWMKMPADSCPGGAKDTEELCTDVTAIMPSSMDDKSGVAKWKATISVFNYDSEDGPAQQWFEKEYYMSSLASATNPKAINIKTDPIGGNSALRFQWLSGTLAKPTSFTSVYAVVMGSHAVVVQAPLQSSADKYDHRNDYGPVLDQLIQSVKFPD